MGVGDVLAVLRVLREVDIDAWVSGGWGIDALLGEETRRHDDLDLAFRAEDEARLTAVLR